MKNFKKYLLVLMTFVIFISVPLQVDAAVIKYRHYFVPGFDQYRMDFTYPTGTTNYNLHFVSRSNNVYDLHFPRVPTKILYLTCNGVYSVQFYDSNDNEIGSFNDIITDQIRDGSCNSYAGASKTGSNDLNATNAKSGTTNNLTWDAPEAGGTSEVYKDGVLVSDGSNNSYSGSDGSYVIINKDASGEITGSTDLTIPEYDGSSGGTNGTGDDGNNTPSEPNECATLICQCIQALKPTLDQINENTNGQLQKLDDLVTAINQVKTSVDSVKTSVDSVKTSVDSVKTAVDGVREELHPDAEYPVKGIEDYEIPTIEDNEPLENPLPKFTDETIYFTDQGDALEPTVFPLAPQPSESWKVDEETVVEQQEVLEADPIMEKSETLERDQFFERDAVMEKSPVLERDAPLIQDKTEYELRWRSEQYQMEE